MLPRLTVQNAIQWVVIVLVALVLIGIATNSLATYGGTFGRTVARKVRGVAGLSSGG